jgi:hypothetical protein
MRSIRLWLVLAGSLALAGCPGDRERDTAVVGDTLPLPAAEPGAAPGPPPVAGTDTLQTYLVRLETGDQRQITGTAGFERDPGGVGTRVIVRIQDEAGGGTYQGHIHRGNRCDAPGSVVTPLEPVTTAGGTGQSVTTVDLPMETIFDANHLVVYHEPGGSPGAPLLCGSVPALPAHLQR